MNGVELADVGLSLGVSGPISDKEESFPHDGMEDFMNRKAPHLLLVEEHDKPVDDLLARLGPHGYGEGCVRVSSISGYRAALESSRFDAILCVFPHSEVELSEALALRGEVDGNAVLIGIATCWDGSLALDAMRHGAADVRAITDVDGIVEALERVLSAGKIQRQKELSEKVARGQSEILEMIFRRMPVSAILDHVVRRVEALSPGEVMACIMLASADGTHLTFGAGPSLPAGFRERLESVPIIEGHGSCGTAAALERLDIVEDVSVHAAWGCVRDLAEEMGIRSCWSVPVFSADHKVLGTLSIYHRSKHVPKSVELEWVEMGTVLVSLAIERGRAAEQMRQSEVLFRIAGEAAHIGGWTVDVPDGRVTWSDKVRAIHEAEPDYMPDLEGGMNFYAPEWRERIRAVFMKCQVEGIPFDEQLEIITAKEKRVWVRAIGEAIRNADGRITRIQGAFQNIALEKQAEMAEEVTRSNELRYLSQRNALISLNLDIASEQLDLMAALRRITETAARTLNVARASIWRYTPDRSMIVCIDQFDLASGEHSSGSALMADEYTEYFDLLSRMELIAADDAYHDPITQQFAESYLIPNGVTSTLDLPIRFGSKINYFMCNEHMGPPRHWTSDEKTFGVAVVNQISLALESSERARAQAEVLRSHQRFQSVAAATNDTIWDWNLETDAFWWYDGFAKLYGRSVADSEASIHLWIRQIHPEDRERVVKGIYAAIGRGETHWSDEYRFVSMDGTIFHVRDRGEILRGQSGRAIRMVGGMTDLSQSKAAEAELRRSHRALRMLSSCNEMLVRAASEAGLLEEACRLAVEVGGYRMAWIGYAGEDPERRVVPMAHAGHEDGYLSEVVISWADDKLSGQGAAGRAIRSGSAVVVPDIKSDPKFQVWMESATARGYRSIVCLPLHNKVRPFGVLCLYGADVHHAGQDEMKMLREMSNDISFGIENIRSREERNRAQEVVVKVAQAVSSGVGSEFFDLLTRNMVEAMDAHGGLIGRYDASINSVETLSFFLDGKLMDNVTYGLEGTPCEEVAAGEMCVFESGVQQRFPEDHLLVHYGIESYVGIPLMHRDGKVAGIMVVFFSAKLTETALVQSTLRIFAARAASELDRQQADARIHEQASLLDKARDAIIVRSLDHRITFWNKGAERLYGWSAEEVMGEPVHELIYQGLAEFTKAHEHTLEHGEWIGEIRQVNREGRELTIEGRWTLVRDEQGRPESVFALNTDISEHRKLEQQFLRAQRMESIGTLAGGIAHDLNNILAPISMSIELLQMQVTDARSQELLATLATSARRGAEMVGQVLSYARGVEGQHVEVHPLPVIREIENILRGTILRGIELEVRASRDLWIIHGDPTQIHQVILNLCLNAHDAVREGGKISILASNVQIDSSFAAMNLEADEGPHVCIEVKDSGAGIPPEIMDRIFDPFFTTKSVGKGTGLGLSSSLAIVRSHGGFIRATSEPTAGSRFRIYLPASPESGIRPTTDEVHHLPRGAGETILVVDDEPTILAITRQTLETFGYRVLVAATGDEAVTQFSQQPSAIDVVLTDMMMPGMDGSATIERLRKIDPAIKIIATSGVRSNRDLIDRSPKSGVMFLEKPYSSEALLKCLNDLLAVES
ncbi:MAG: GAF domain-containing protein [Verrucomicrobiota bacterium]